MVLKEKASARGCLTTFGFKGAVFMYCLTKQELAAILQKAMDFDVLDVVFNDEGEREKTGVLGTLVCDAGYANREKAENICGIDTEAWAHLILEGRYEIDIDAVLKAIEECEKASVMDALANALERSERTGAADGAEVIENELT